jgi:hypothetical protein
MMRAKVSSFFNNNSANSSSAAAAATAPPQGSPRNPQSSPQQQHQQQQDSGAALAGGAGPTSFAATVTMGADEEEAATGDGGRSSGAAATDAAALPTPSSAGSAGKQQQQQQQQQQQPRRWAAGSATPSGGNGSGGSGFFFRRPSLSLPGTPRLTGRASPSPTGRTSFTPSAASGRLQWLQAPWGQTAQQPAAGQQPAGPEKDPLLVFYVKLSNLICQWEAPHPLASIAVAASAAPPPPTPPPAPLSLRAVSSAASYQGPSAGGKGSTSAAPPLPTLRQALSSSYHAGDVAEQENDTEKMQRSPSTPSFPTSHAPAPGAKGAAVATVCSAPSSVQCSPARQPSTLNFNFNSTGGGSVLDVSSSGAAAAPSVARLAVLFPLPSENRLETASRTLEYLDATICHEWTTWSRERKGLLKSTTHHHWAQAATAEGVTISAAVKVGGSLHMLLKLLDPNGQEIAQAVVPLPKPGHGRRVSTSTSGGGGAVGAGVDVGVGPWRAQQGVRAALTLHTAYRGTLTCDVEIVKVRGGKRGRSMVWMVRLPLLRVVAHRVI